MGTGPGKLLLFHSGLMRVGVGTAGATQQVHDRGGGGRRVPIKGGVDRVVLSPESDDFNEFSSMAGSLRGPCPFPLHAQLHSSPQPHPGSRCLRAPGTCPSADVPRRWCDCFSAVIFNRL